MCTNIEDSNAGRRRGHAFTLQLNIIACERTASGFSGGSNALEALKDLPEDALQRRFVVSKGLYDDARALGGVGDVAFEHLRCSWRSPYCDVELVDDA